jgi:saccharopine dehydrogenase-like NADP-dependent oxidoreductase
VLAREEFYKAYYPKTINGKEWRAISWTTAASVASVVELVASQQLPQQGFIKQEDILLDALYSTRSGKTFVE